MRKLTIAMALLLLTGCTPLKVGLLRVLQDNTAYVHEDEYVIWADGDWCEWAPTSNLILASGERWCGNKPARAPGVYVVNSKGEVISERDRIRKLKSVDNVAELGRVCASFHSQGVACAPNLLIDKLATNDPLFGSLWGLSSEGLNVEKLWKDGASSPDIRVAVVDTGVRCDHEDLPGCVKAYDAIRDEEDQTDENGHGTHCAGTAVARGNNGTGISGVSQGAQLFAAKFMGASGGGSLASASRAIRWAILNGVHIISASWGAPYGNPVLATAIKRADEAGILFIAAAGNDAKDLDKTPQYPASYDFPNMIAVGSHDEDQDKSWFSNWGQRTVEVFAPGSRIISTWKDGKYNRLDGTSMATPHIAGLAAVLWQRELGQGTKREQMLRVKEQILNMGGDALRDVSAHGVVRYGNTQECNQKRCKKCLRGCEQALGCKCHKWRKCRKDCRDTNNCEAGCK